MLASETNKHWYKGYISGSFDMFHIGHLNLIRQARERCDYLIVGVLADEIVASGKKKWPMVPLHERMEIVGALRYVDEVDVTTQPLLNKLAAWGKYRFNAMFSGDDHMGDGWADGEAVLKKLGVDIVFFPYTKEVSTTRLQELILPPKANDADKARRIGDFTHLFPFDKVNKGERIVIYGIGNVGQQYARQISALNFCKIAAFADTYAKPNDMFEGVRCISPEELAADKDMSDRIVIASTTYYEQILGRLRTLGIYPWRIV